MGLWISFGTPPSYLYLLIINHKLLLINNNNLLEVHTYFNFNINIDKIYIH